MSTETIKIDHGQMDQLYETLYKGEIQTDKMIRMLAAFKRNLEAQGFADSSLSQAVAYADALISLMEELANGMVLLQENASNIAKTFVETDQLIGKAVKNYDSYVVDRYMDKYGHID
ncbi:hypothetical protein [Numidum massiliense]|uniref:hypothetical protein n=1 Tax=Numidum massiliense TaxID=1522315 RepID=UPI0006D52E68|nr:hypothetical protein [Numidum massiliense]